MTNQPCPDRPWLIGILLGFPLFMTGGVLMISLVGAPFGVPLFAAGVGLMLSSKPCGGSPARMTKADQASAGTSSRTTPSM